MEGKKEGQKKGRQGSEEAKDGRQVSMIPFLLLPFPSLLFLPSSLESKTQPPAKVNAKSKKEGRRGWAGGGKM